ncbi:MAG TPA: AMP-binding protein, partial [Acidimicrobiales bacterium]
MEPVATEPPATFAFADVWEAVAPRVPDRIAVVCGPQRRTYGELYERVNRLAHHFVAAGLGPGDHIGLFLKNDAAYHEAMLAAFTIRAVPVNINHRYVAGEL